MKKYDGDKLTRAEFNEQMESRPTQELHISEFGEELELDRYRYNEFNDHLQSIIENIEKKSRQKCRSCSPVFLVMFYIVFSVIVYFYLSAKVDEMSVEWRIGLTVLSLLFGYIAYFLTNRRKDLQEDKKRNQEWSEYLEKLKERVTAMLIAFEEKRYKVYVLNITRKFYVVSTPWSKEFFVECDYFLEKVDKESYAKAKCGSKWFIVEFFNDNEDFFDWYSFV